MNKIWYWIIGLVILLALVLFMISSNLKEERDLENLEDVFKEKFGEFPFDPIRCENDVLNCGDFPTQEAAQESYDNLLDKCGKDVDNLDADNNGQACEGLP